MENHKQPQRATMEFLLINHPLDCPICDQGGECELQDLAMGFGKGVSRYTERKRVVKDKNLGSLVSTDMTRCIHCTRCVRFGQEVAGLQELGTTGRGENTQIGTYIERSVDHELSGNIIDLCPVGALNSKPFRFKGRGWEMTQHTTVSPHDSLGSNLYAHVRRGQLLRVVPKPNEDINETWISDRDRFGYTGVYADDRLQVPMVKREGEWVQASWETALTQVADTLKDLNFKSDLGVLTSPNATLEELYLLKQLTVGLGSENFDHRLRQPDLTDQENDPVFPWLSVDVAELEHQNAILSVGARLRAEVPMLAHRLRKASLNGCKVMFANPDHYEHLFPASGYVTSGSDSLVHVVGGLVKAAANETGKLVPDHVSGQLSDVTVTEEHRSVVKQLAQGEKAVVLLGHIALRHPEYSVLRALTAVLADLTGSRLGYVPEAANSAGAWLAGAVPHRSFAGQQQEAGLSARDMLSRSLDTYLLFNIEPEADTLEGQGALEVLRDARQVVCLTTYFTETMASYANVVLPIGSFAETSGTYVNLEGRWQSFGGVAQPVGEARPGWKVLRVLGNLLQLDGFQYDSSEEVRDELHGLTQNVAPSNDYKGKPEIRINGSADDGESIAMYSVDGMVRRAKPLQQTKQAQEVS
ncbi:MAG: NADH-quinone oxidoreductase subunit NuoG [Pseudomonadota bacterium]